jgi:ELWxxDGT repeat protein
MIKDIFPGAGSSSITSLTAVGAAAFFSANDGVNGDELWTSDGTSAGTFLFADLTPGALGSGPTEIKVSGSLVFFSADDSQLDEPLDRELWAIAPCTMAPGEITDLIVQADKVTLAWDSVPGAVHDVVRGQVDDLPVGGGPEVCLAPGVGGNTTIDPAIPAVGQSFWYLVRGRNACGAGSYGTDSSANPRTTSACP